MPRGSNSIEERKKSEIMALLILTSKKSFVKLFGFNKKV